MLFELCLTIVVLIVVAAVMIGTGWALYKAFLGLVWTCGVAYSYVGAIGFLVGLGIFVFAIWETVSRMRPAAEAGNAPGATGSPAAKPARGRTRGLVCAGSAAVIMSGNLCLNIAAARIDAHYQSRRQEGVDIYKNHDLSKLVGQCVRLAILRHAEGIPKGDERTALESIAAIAPAQWAAMTDAEGSKQPDPRVLALADAQLTDFIREPRAEALHQAEWALLLTDWRAEAKAAALTSTTLQGVAATIAKDFGITLREALKADFERGGKAWAAMQLDIAQQLLNRTPVSLATGNEQINATLAEVKGLLSEDAKGLPALHRTILDARQAQDEHARAVTRNFDQVVGVLQRIQTDVTVVKADVAETKQDVKETKGDVKEAKTDIKAIQSMLEINDRIKRIEVDPAFTPEQKQQQTLALLDKKMALTVPGQPAAPTPLDVQAAVRDIFKNAPKVVRFAALARVGLDKEADVLASEVERATAPLTDADRYKFCVARGDQYWNARDLWHAATWYAQAMALRVDDPAVVRRAAKSTLLGPRMSGYAQELQLAQSWVERCLATLATTPSASVIDTAGLHATLASMLWMQGKSSASIAPAREALRLLAGDNDAPADMACGVLLDAAQALLYAGALAEASAAVDRAVTTAEQVAGPNTGTAALTYAARAQIGMECGDLAGAEADIQKTIDWFNAQSPRDERSLSIHYASRAEIRRQRGDLARAEADIKRSIDWENTRSPRDERGLAFRYATRARIRQERGDLTGAEADISRSIDWNEAQSPRDERSLAIHYASRADIRRRRGDLVGAETDIKRSIDWDEAQVPRNERALAIRYAIRACIREQQAIAARKAGDTGVASALFTQAKADIAKAVKWFEANLPSDGRGLAILRKDQARIDKAAKGEKAVFGADHE